MGVKEFSRDSTRETVVAMEDDRIVAVGLLTQTNLNMLGNSLKLVFAVDDETAEFDELLHALDRIGERR